MNHPTHPRGATDVVSSTRSVFGAPCWVSLTSRDTRATEAFYSAVLGWRWRSARLGDRFRVALADGTPVAGIAAVASVWQMVVAWTPYFAVPSADDAVARVRERGGTAAVGPLFPPGRAALLADRDGAIFGIWEGELLAGWEAWRRAAPTFVRLHTRDAFDAAIFYGEILEWASDRPGSCQVHYEGDEVVLRSRGTWWPASSRARWRRRPTPPSGRTGRSTSRSRTWRPASGPRRTTAAASCGTTPVPCRTRRCCAIRTGRSSR